MNSTTLTFDPATLVVDEDKDLRDGLSVAHVVGKTLWVANDETATIERLSLLADGTYGHHTRFALDALLDLPAGSACEVDVEGVASDGAYLWLTGSHSLKRKKPKKKDDDDKAIERLARIDADPNRNLLARVPVVETRAGAVGLTKSAGAARAAQLAGGDRGNELTVALATDPHLGPFMGIPGKDNGFDVEGLAVAGDRLFLGLRGPVLRGHAVILSLRLEERNEGRLHLVTAKHQKRPYAKHFLELEGLGLRDLCAFDEDLLLLAGPTMTLAGPFVVYRWRGALATPERDSLVRKAELQKVAVVPSGTGVPEGLGLVEKGARSARVLITYDSPSASRMVGESGVTADLIDLAWD